MRYGPTHLPPPLQGFGHIDDPWIANRSWLVDSPLNHWAHHHDRPVSNILPNILYLLTLVINIRPTLPWNSLWLCLDPIEIPGLVVPSLRQCSSYDHFLELLQHRMCWHAKAAFYSMIILFIFRCLENRECSQFTWYSWLVVSIWAKRCTLALLLWWNWWKLFRVQICRHFLWPVLKQSK